MGMAIRLGTTPDFLMMCFYMESKLNPSFQTSLHRGTGLIQMSDGDIKKTGTTPQRLSTMKGSDQLLYIEKFLVPFTGQMTSLAETYFACFYPNALGMSQSYYFRFPTKYQTANRIFPLRNNNRIQKWQIDKALRGYFFKLGWEG
jgi:hypothetical protein